MVIVGVSFDQPEDNQSWAEAQDYTFELWSDDDRTLAVYYGAASSTSAAYADRKTVILDAEGTLVLEYESVNPSSSPQDVLDDCTLLFGE